MSRARALGGGHPRRCSRRGLLPRFGLGERVTDRTGRAGTGRGPTGAAVLTRSPSTPTTRATPNRASRPSASSALRGRAGVVVDHRGFEDLGDALLRLGIAERVVDAEVWR